MPPMTPAEVEAYLQEPHVAVLSVSRPDRGPVAVPIWDEYRDGRIWMITSTGSVHGWLMQESGRATITLRSEIYGGACTSERCVMAEGPLPSPTTRSSHWYAASAAGTSRTTGPTIG